ncbi:MAG: xylulose kinase, partial [Anaerolineae bacterium]|nr:xylulose kinase [Anaerolineae bacterium]
MLGIDFGTESVRAGVFTPTGALVGSHAESYPLRHPRPSWAEQQPDEWWAAMVGAVRGAVAAANVSPEAIVGISADTTSCTVVFLDEHFKPLRPAIIWMDVRAADQARRIASSGYPALKYNGYGNVSAEWMPCKALWVKENEPELYQQAHYVGDFIDWLTLRLTGEWTGSINNTSLRWYYDRNVGGWPVDFYEGIGLGDLIEKFPQRILDMGQVAGGLTPSTAAELGLVAGTPVAEGGADALVAMIGLDVTQPGKIAFIVGSSHLLLGQSATQFHAKGIFGAYTDCVIPGQYTVEGGQISTGSILRWFKESFIGGRYLREVDRTGASMYDVMTPEAMKIRPGSDGLVVLDYWQGNRTPLVDPLARGMMWGLTLSHTPAHVFRAIMEGVAYGTEHILRVFRENGYQTTEIVAAGGPVKSK